jgi:hypothetical protein
MVVVLDRDGGDLTPLFVVIELSVTIRNSLPEPKEIYSFRSGLERPDNFVWIVDVFQPFVFVSQVGGRYEFAGNDEGLGLYSHGIKQYRHSLNTNRFFIDHSLSIGP